jgi:hypothetical protein
VNRCFGVLTTAAKVGKSSRGRTIHDTRHCWVKIRSNDAGIKPSRRPLRAPGCLFIWGTPSCQLAGLGQFGSRISSCAPRGTLPTNTKPPPSPSASRAKRAVAAARAYGAASPSRSTSNKCTACMAAVSYCTEASTALASLPNQFHQIVPDFKC